MKRVLVTGAGGQLGRSIRDAAGSYPELECFFLDRRQLDVTQPEEVRKAFRELRPDYCVNCAAYTQVDLAERETEHAMQINAEGAANLARECAETAAVMIQISTDYVFDGEKESGYLPSDEPRPINAYGRSKLAGERLVMELAPAWFIIRTSWVYSREYGPNFYTRILEKARNGEEIRVVDNQVGCPTPASGLAGYILELIRNGDSNYGIRHFTGGTPMTWFEFARQILRDNGWLKQSRLVRDNKSRSFARRPKNSVLR